MSEQKLPARLIAGLLLCCLLATALSAAQSQATQPGRSTILFTLSDKKGKSVSVPLGKADLRLLEDGVEQELLGVGRLAEEPLALVMMLDTSVSQERALVNAKTAANEFLSSVVREGKDSVAVISFTGEPVVEQPLAGDLAGTRAAINRLSVKVPPGYGQIIYGPPPRSSKSTGPIPGSTAIWDSVIQVCEKLMANAAAGSRRAILLFSDGEDTSSRSRLSAAIEAAIKADVTVYCMVIGDLDFGLNPKTLGKLAEQTGGRAVSPKDMDALRESLAQMGKDLRAPFALSFSPANKNRDGSFRKLKIEIINPELRKQGLRLSHQQGYFAR